MTLFEKVQRLKIVQDIIGRIGITHVEKDKLKFFAVSSHDEVLYLINLLEEIDMFQEIIARAKSFNLGASNGYIPEDRGTGFQSMVNTLKTILNAVLPELEKIAGEPKAENIFIKLPPVSDFRQLSKTTEIFDKILSQAIINDTINGQVVIEGVENGSIWLNVYLGSITAVSLIGTLAWSAAVIYKKFQEGKYFEKLVEERGLDIKHRQNLVDSHKQITDILIDAEVRHIYNENFGKVEPDPEQLSRLRLSLKLLAEELSKGAEVHPSLTAPEHVTNLFPNMKNLPSIESRIKKIEDKK